MSPPSPTDAVSPPRLGLQAGIIWTFTGQVVAAGVQWSVVALLARQGQPSDVGLYTLGLALVSPVFLLCGLQLRSLQATDAQSAFTFAQYFSLRSVTLAVALAVTAALSLVYPHAAGLMLCLGVAKTAEFLSDVLHGLMQRHERLDWVAQSTMLRWILGVACLAGLYAVTRSVTAGTLGLALASSIVFAGLDVPRARHLTASQWWTRRIGTTLFHQALPLGVVVALVALGSTLPRLALERWVGAESLGIYAALSYVTVAGSVVVVALGTALTTRLAQRYAAQDTTGFLRLVALLTAAAALLGTLLCAAAWWAGPWLLGGLYGPVYAAQSHVFFWLTLGGALGYLASCAGFAVTATRRFREQLPLFAGVTVVLGLACLWLIPHHGLLGAAWATLMGAAAQLIGSWLIVMQALRDGPRVEGEPR